MLFDKLFASQEINGTRSLNISEVQIIVQQDPMGHGPTQQFQAKSIPSHDFKKTIPG